MANEAEFLKMLLLAVMLAMALLALVYLQGRRLGAWQQVGWGLLILLLPLLGPFLAIWARPGEKI
jgi:hypothetical protein